MIDIPRSSRDTFRILSATIGIDEVSFIAISIHSNTPASMGRLFNDAIGPFIGFDCPVFRNVLLEFQFNLSIRLNDFK